MKRFTLFAMALAVLLALAMPTPAQAVAEWTIMVYMNGDNTLDAGMVSKLNMMEAASLSSGKYKVIVQLDRKSGNGDWSDTRRYEVRYDGANSAIGSLLVNGAMGEKNMGSPEVLADFAIWAMQTYPANHYSLIMADHGNGWYKGGATSGIKGFSFDDNTGGDLAWDNNISIANGDFTYALDKIKQQLGRKLDHIAWDACLMGMWEVLAISKDYADVATVSEDIMYSYDYTTFLNTVNTALTSPGTISSANLGKAMISNRNGNNTLAVVDLTKIDAITDKVNVLAEALQANRSANNALIKNTLNNADLVKLGLSDGFKYHVDLYQFADRIYFCTNPTPSAAVKTAANDVKTAITNAIIDKQLSSVQPYPSLRGISVYQCDIDLASGNPLNYDAESYKRLPFSGQTCWDEYLRNEPADALNKVAITSPPTYSTIFQSATIKVEATDYHGLSKVEFYENGVLLGAKWYAGSGIFTWDWMAGPSKTTDRKIDAKAYDVNGNTNTSTIIIRKPQGADSYYNKMNVGNAAYVVDPKTGNTLPCQLVSVSVSGGVRYAAVSVNGDVRTVNAGEMQKVPNTGLFIYAATVFYPGSTPQDPSNFSEIMIAPYQYPSVDILSPASGEYTNSNVVKVATNYSGKNIPWNGVGNPPLNPYNLKTLSYNGASTIEESYVWTLSGTAGARTMTVSITDKLGTTSSKSVTVNYDPTKPFYVFRGPFSGADGIMKNLSIWSSYNNRSVANIRVSYATNGYMYWDQSCTYRDRDGELDMYAQHIAGRAVGCDVPSGASGVYVVDKNQYLTGSFSSAFGHAAFTYYELYDHLAYILGKDVAGNYRVWYGYNSDRSGAVPIPALHLPIPPVPTYSNIQKTSVQINWKNLEGEGGYQLQRATSSNGPWTTIASPGADVNSYTDATVSAGANYWYRVIGVPISTYSNQIGASSQVTTMSLSGFINGDFEGVGGWPAPYDYSDPYGSGQRTLWEIASGGPYGKYGHVYLNNGSTGGGRSYDVTQTFPVPADALIFQFRKNGGAATINGVAITPDINGWGLTTFDISPYRGQPVTFKIRTEIPNPSNGYCGADSKFDNFTVIGTPPTVAITSPANGAAINVNTPTTITATATDAAGVNRVEFFVNDAYLGQSTAGPNYTCAWTPTAAKSYTLRAVGYDNCGNSSIVTGYNGIVNGDFEGTGGWPAPTDWSDWTEAHVLWEIASGGPYGKYGHVYCYTGFVSGVRSYDVWQTFMVPLDATTLQFRKDGGAATLNGIAITPDVNGWGLTTFDISPYRGQSVTFKIHTETPNNGQGGQSAESKFDNIVINRSISSDLSTITVTATGMVGYYKLDAVSGTIATDNSGNDNQGTLVNGPTWVAGQVGNALSFDGVDDYVDAGNVLNPGTNSFSMGCWIKTSSLSQLWILGKADLGGNGLGYWLEVRSNKVRVQLRNKNGPSPYGFVLDGNTVLNDGKWHYIVFTRDVANNSAIAYVDGIIDGSTTTNINVNVDNSVNLTIGRAGINSNPGYFNGLIDEVRIYNRALSGGDVQALYNQGILVAHWKLDESAGSTFASDATGNGNTGTLVNGPVWVNPGKVSNALSFNGSNQSVGTGKSLLSNLSSFTMAGWVKPNAGGSRIGFFGQNDAIEFGFNGGSNVQGWTSGGGYVNGNYPYPFNEWHHVALVGDGTAGGLKLYFDGSVAASGGTATSNYGSSSYAVNIGGGGIYDPTGNWFNGAIDDARIYNKALSGPEVQALYNETGGGSTVFSDNFSDLNYTSNPAWTNVTDWGVGGTLDASTGALEIYQTANAGNSARTTSTTAYGTWQMDFKLGSRGGCSNTRVIWYFMENGGSYYYVRVQNTANSIKIGKQTGDLATASFTPVDGTWYNLKITRTSSGQFQVFINGALQLTATDNSLTTSSTTRIASQRDCGYADIFVDNISIYDYVKSASIVTMPEKPQLPTTTLLLSCAPNPFTGQTAINFQLAKPEQTTIAIYNVAGQKVKTLVNECLRPGYHSVKWNGKDESGNKAAAGVYLYRMSAGEYSAVKKMTVLR